MTKHIFLLVFIACMSLCSCDKQQRLEKEISRIPVEITIERFDTLFATVNAQKLPTLKQEYPFLFPKQYADSIWLQKARDTIQLELNEEVAKVFPNVVTQEQEITALLQHVKYYFPQITIPRVITITSDVDYRHKIILKKDLLLVSLDTYLGADHHFYEAIQEYLKRNFNKDRISSDVATAYAKQFVPLPEKRTFLANIIFYGKVLYLKTLFMPALEEAAQLEYTAMQYDWATANEIEIWRYFIDKKLLYSTQANLHPRFLYPAPFSKFYLEEIDKEAPDRIGQYIGWKIVSSYMENNDVSLQEILHTDADVIFKNSKYKPNK